MRVFKQNENSNIGIFWSISGEPLIWRFSVSAFSRLNPRGVASKLRLTSRRREVLVSCQKSAFRHNLSLFYKNHEAESDHAECFPCTWKCPRSRLLNFQTCGYLVHKMKADVRRIINVGAWTTSSCGATSRMKTKRTVKCCHANFLTLGFSAQREMTCNFTAAFPFMRVFKQNENSSFWTFWAMLMEPQGWLPPN